jgi:hypothetical protein
MHFLYDVIQTTQETNGEETYMGNLNNLSIPFISLITESFYIFFLSSILGNQQNAAFCFVSLANLFCCFLSMALIMAPKIIFIRKHAHDPREKEDDEKDTAELELKYREILRENENFQKKISEVSGMLYTVLHVQKLSLSLKGC